MADTGATGARRWFQSEFILRTARTLYRVLAAVTLIVAVIALAVAAFFQLVSLQPSPRADLPPPYQPTAKTIDPNVVAARLSPPTNIRFIVTRPDDETVAESRPFGFFVATTPNGLAAYPEDFDIVGGKDAQLFDRAPFDDSMRYVEDGPSSARNGPHAGLAPRPETADRINGMLSGVKRPYSVSYSVSVVARDGFGNVSRPQTVTFQLGIAPSSGAQAARPAPGLSSLEQLAREIALRVNPERSPAYFDAYRRALGVPQQCGTNAGDGEFVAAYRTAFDALHQRIGAQNVEAFYRGVCDAWGRELSRQQGLANEADRARSDAMARGMTARAAYALTQAGASVAKWGALTFAGIALAFFMTVSLSLAFLAIEGHTDAIRRAVDLLAMKKD